MQALRLLRKQVRALWKLEETLPPEQRTMHSWQLVAMQSDVPYLVGKGGANTFFYRIGTKGEMTHVMPDEMMAVLDKWTADRYVVYAITRSTLAKAKRQSKSLQELKERVHSKYCGYFIVGVGSDGKLTKLFTLKTGLTSNVWVPVK